MHSTIRLAILFSAAFFSFSLHGVAPIKEHSPLFESKKELVNLLRKADQQRDWMTELVDKKEVDLTQLSLAEIKDTITKLELYKERLMHAQDNGHSFGADEKRYLLLIQELIRQLTNAHLSYEKRMKGAHAVRKIAVPVGTAVAVTGGLLLLGTFVPEIVDVDITTALLCGLATGAAVGAITYQGDVVRGLGALKDSLSDAWRARSMRAIGQVTISVAGAAALGGLLWQKRHSIAGTFGLRGRPQKSLEQMAQENLTSQVY